MKSEFTLAFNEIAERSKLKREVILEALEKAIESAYRRALNASTAQHVVAKLDPGTGAVRVFAEKEVVDSVQDQRTEVTLEEARTVDPEVKLGEMVVVESTPPDFGRIAAQTAKQVILQRIREAERESQYQEYAEREGDIVNGTVQSVTPQAVTIGLGRTEAVMPRNQQVPGERYRPHDKVRAYVLEVRKTSRGPQIIVSRSHKNMLRRLLEYEVPELYSGAVEVKSIARESGHRSKVAVAAVQPGVDPVGACVGMRGVRIQSIVRELNDEKIDVIEWNPEQSVFIAKALSPAKVSGVYLDDDPVDGRTALVIVPDDQLSLAIGREGQNARLAAKLTGWRIDIKSLSEAAGQAVKDLRDNAAYAELAASQGEAVGRAEAILVRKAEGKPIAPEDYQILNKMVDVYERALVGQREGEREERARRRADIRKTIPAGAYRVSTADSGLPERIAKLLDGAGYETVGAVMEQLALDADVLLGVHGFGAKAMEELQAALTGMTFPEPEPEPEPVAEPAAEAAAPVEAAAAEAPAQATGEAALVGAAEGGAEPAAIAEPTTGEPVEAEASEETEDDEALDKKKKKKGKKQNVTVEYDPDRDVLVAHHMRKPGRTREWETPE